LIANCGALGVNWERLSLSGYLEALEAHNDAHDAPGAAEPAGEPSERLNAVMRARLMGNDGGKPAKR
jgi:hypothetical protein